MIGMHVPRSVKPTDSLRWKNNTRQARRMPRAADAIGQETNSLEKNMTSQPMRDLIVVIPGIRDPFSNVRAGKRGGSQGKP